MICAIARNPVVPIIEDGDLDFGEALVKWSCDFVCRLARENISDSRTEREVNDVLDVLRKHGGWVSKSELARSQRLKGMKAKDRDSLLADLVNVQGTVELSSEQGDRGRPSVKDRKSTRLNSSH